MKFQKFETFKSFYAFYLLNNIIIKKIKLLILMLKINENRARTIGLIDNYNFWDSLVCILRDALCIYGLKRSSNVLVVITLLSVTDSN